MNEELRSILIQMEPLLAKLKACPPETFSTRKKLPDCGIYVFTKTNSPSTLAAPTRYTSVL